ncbi:uncharacterized protein LOC132263829 [Phlebotomus argentipes]|uniref:uncharacterized protein LOC132263829 n=1 Tax=Phlebotomus argentipes TaxID=94469 RepID=UPI002892C6EE|nr:uncharacterized protein LOC132263829 [Phlebotomus argentipes]
MSASVHLDDDQIQKFISDVITETIAREQSQEGWTDRHERLEFEIVSSRVIRVLDILIERTEMLLCLPAMMEHSVILEEHFSAEQIDHLKMAILTPNHAHVSELVNTISRSSVMEKIPQFRDTVSVEGNNILQNLRELRKIADWRMKMTSAREIIKERMLHQMYKDNAKFTMKVADLKRKYETERKKTDAVLAIKLHTIDKCRREIEEKKRENQEYINHQIFQSERNMMNISEMSRKNQQELRSKVEQSRTFYEDLLQRNLREEERLRERKQAVQDQLLAWIGKYDADIGDRSKELMQLEEVICGERGRLDLLKRRFMAQEVEYIRLMAQKEAEEKRIQEEKLLLFMMNHAAVTIQRWWRRVLARKKSKKGRKGKGKKKGKK